MGWYLDGRVTAVIGTHTHIPTADDRVLTQGTAYQTDVGMSGPYDSIIGVAKGAGPRAFPHLHARRNSKPPKATPAWPPSSSRPTPPPATPSPPNACCWASSCVVMNV